MKAFAVPAFILLSLCWPAAAQSYTPEAFSAELGRLEAAIERDPAGALAGLPSGWDVATETNRYSIPAAALTDQLRRSDLNAARTVISSMRRQIDTFRSSSPQTDARPRTALKAILARPEFKDVAPPNAWQLFVERVRAWILDWLNRIFTYAAQHPTGSQILFWTLIIASIVALGTWLVRLWTTADRIRSLAEPLPPEHKLLSWQEWLTAAREAAAKGDHRQAIRCAYWAGVARLQQDRTIRINFTDTPRERLHLLAQPSRLGSPLPAEQLAPLTSITHSFERCWYAKLPVNAEEVARSFENLEALGCQAD